MLLFMILRFFFHFDKIMSYAVILSIGKNLRCFLLIVVPLTGVCSFIVLWLSAIIGYMDSWESTGEPGHVHIGVCAYSLRGVPGRYEYIWSLSWLGGGPVRVSCPLGLVLACVCVIDQVGGVAGQYDFLVFLFWRVGTIEIVTGCCI